LAGDIICRCCGTAGFGKLPFQNFIRVESRPVFPFINSAEVDYQFFGDPEMRYHPAR